jgi:hypothetical protein
MTDRGLDLALIGLAFAVRAILVVLLEIPTGGLADAIGRKPIALASQASTLISFVFLLVVTGPVTLMLYALFQGVGAALHSGALEAWYVDKLKAADPDVSLQKNLARISVAQTAAMLAGAGSAARCRRWRAAGTSPGRSRASASRSSPASSCGPSCGGSPWSWSRSPSTRAGAAGGRPRHAGDHPRRPAPRAPHPGDAVPAAGRRRDGRGHHQPRDVLAADRQPHLRRGTRDQRRVRRPGLRAGRGGPAGEPRRHALRRPLPRRAGRAGRREPTDEGRRDGPAGGPGGRRRRRARARPGLLRDRHPERAARHAAQRGDPERAPLDPAQHQLAGLLPRHRRGLERVGARGEPDRPARRVVRGGVFTLLTALAYAGAAIAARRSAERARAAAAE